MSTESGKKILIIEDEKPISDIIKFNLIKEGYGVETAYDGQEGLDKALSCDCDLVLLDIMLPIMSGFEVCKKIRETSEMPIIMLTAKEEEALLKERENLVNQIDERMMVAYTKVRANAHNKLAVVTVSRDACGGCFNKIPPQRSLDIEESKKIIVCEYCGRILISSAFENEN